MRKKGQREVWPAVSQLIARFEVWPALSQLIATIEGLPRGSGQVSILVTTHEVL